MKLSLKTLPILLAVSAAVLGMSTVAYASGNGNAQTYVRGDANGDGIVSVYDVTLIQRIIAEMETDPDGAIAQRANIISDKLDIGDAAEVQRYIAEFDNVYSIGETVTAEEIEPATQPTTFWFSPGENELPFIPN